MILGRSAQLLVGGGGFEVARDEEGPLPPDAAGVRLLLVNEEGGAVPGLA